jgi:enterochelin esterase-like enzyme
MTTKLAATRCHCFARRTVKKVIHSILLALLAHAAFAQGVDCKSTATGDLHIEHLASRIFPGDHVLRVWLPPGYSDPANSQRAYPVLYMLDGQNLFDVCPSMNHDEWQMDESLTRLIQAGKVEPLVVVGIDAPDDGPLRASEYVPFPDYSAPFSFEPNGVRFPEFLTAEVMPRIAAEYRIRTGRASTAVGGASYGAIAALYALIAQPRVFGLGLIESPWTTVGNGELVRLTSHLTIAPLRVSVGVGDNEASLYAEPMRKHGMDPDALNHNLARDARLIAENLKESGGSYTALKFTEIPEGTHSEASWRERFPDDIVFIFPGGSGRKAQ